MSQTLVCNTYLGDTIYEGPLYHMFCISTQLLEVQSLKSDRIKTGPKFTSCFYLSLLLTCIHFASFLFLIDAESTTKVGKNGMGRSGTEWRPGGKGRVDKIMDRQ